MYTPIVKTKIRLSIEGLTKPIKDEFNESTLADKTVDMIWSLELSEEGEDLKITPNFSSNIFDLTYYIPNKDGKMDLLNLEIDLNKLKLFDVDHNGIDFMGDGMSYFMRPKSILIDLTDEVYMVTFE